MRLGVPQPSHVGQRGALIVGLAGLLMLAVTGWLAPTIALRGWLIGFTTIGGIALGAVAWLAIHRLTGGRWGEMARHSLRLASSILPLLVLALLPLLIAASSLYPWAADPHTAGSGVAGLELNAGAVGLRSLVLLAAFWLFARAASRGAAGQLAAGVTLLVYGVLMTLLSFDWVLSLDPRFNSSAFGMQLIVEQLAGALCLAVLTTSAPSGDRAWGDLGALLLACVLGESYLILMTFIVDWYGDLPGQAAWFLRRSRHGWAWVEAIGAVGGAIGPMLALLFGRVRHDPALLRLVAVLVLLGIVVENVWLVAPGTGPGLDGWAALAGMVACAALGGLALAVAAGTSSHEAAQMRWRTADGA